MLKLDISNISLLVHCGKCKADIFYYPFDRQSCSWDLLSGYSVQAVVVEALSYEYALHQDTNKEWTFENMKRMNTILVGSFNVSSVVLTATFKRKPSFLILNILTPVIGLGLLNPIVFALVGREGVVICHNIADPGLLPEHDS